MLADRHRAAGDQAAAAHRHQQGIERGLLGEFQSDTAGAREDHRIVVGGHHERAGLGRPLLRQSARLGIDRADLMHGRAIAFEPRHLGR